MRKVGRTLREYKFDSIREARREFLYLSRFYPVEQFKLYRIRKNTKKGKVSYYRDEIPLILKETKRGVPVNLPHLKEVQIVDIIGFIFKSETKLLHLATQNLAESDPAIYDNYLYLIHIVTELIQQGTTYNDWQMFLTDSRVQDYIDKSFTRRQVLLLTSL